MDQIPQETIVAISTAPGRGGIGVVRLSGARAREVVALLLRLRHPLAPARARFAELIDAATGSVLDQAVVTFFAAPHSYTGDDVVEIAAHGSPVLLDHILRQCCANGARLAEPGEFTQRAFLAGRIDLTQAEAVADLIASSTLQQARLAARQLGGTLAKSLAPIKSALVDLIAELEAGIDFAEDDLDVMPSHRITAQIAAIRAPLHSLERSFAYGRVLRDGFRLAIVGSPNVGKSSLFNRLLDRDRAIVAPTPGTTRDTVSESIAIEGIPIEIIDTAGLRNATDQAEQMGIIRSHQTIAEADLVLLVVDATDSISLDHRAILPANSNVLIARNKCDLLPSRNLPEHSRSDSIPAPVLLTSALTGEGIDSLRAAIVAAVAGPALPESAMLTNLRQHQAVQQSLLALDAAHAAITTRIPHEMALLDLYQALHALDTLTGATTTNDILHLIFSRFCIGK